MLSAAYLLALSVAGILAVTRLLPSAPGMVRLAGGFVAGIVVTAWVTYAIALGLSSVTDESLLIGMVVATGLNIAIIAALVPKARIADFRITPVEIVLIGLALVFSFWLMDQRLNTDDSATGSGVVVSANTWGDTALHTALARSFSWGENYPTEYPFYANEPVRYHFGYDFFAGALEEGGFSVVYAFNLPGALGFAAMMMLLFSITRFLFNGYGGSTKHPGSLRNFGVWTGLVAVALLLTNSSFAFIRYFQQFDTVWDALDPRHGPGGEAKGWWDLSSYLALGPYDVGNGVDKISLFNTPNVYLTQTHLIVGMAVVLFIAFGLIQPLRLGHAIDRNRGLLLGVMFGLSFWLNGVLYISAGVFFGALLVVFALFAAYRHAQRADSERGMEFLGHFARQGMDAAWFIVPALLLAIPQVYWLNGNSASNDGGIQRHFGYLVCSAPSAGCHGLDGKGNAEIDLLSLHDWGAFADYWWFNAGLAIPLMALAMAWGTRADRKIFFAAMAVFIFGSTFQLSRDLGGHNHKIFNLWENLVDPFVAFGLVGLWNISTQPLRALGATIDGRFVSYTAKAIVPVVFLFLVLSGLLDFMTIKNDYKVAVFGENEPVIEWIDDNLPRDAVVLTSWGDLYTAPTLAGRGVYLGYDPWAGSAGYNTEVRKQLTSQIYGAQDKATACGLLVSEEIDYVQIGKQERDAASRISLNESLFSTQFTAIGTINNLPGNPFTYYDVEASCGG